MAITCLKTITSNCFHLPDYYQTYFRNYDAAIGRFVGIDPMPESMESMTGYNYAGNNPVMMNDPMGDKAAFKVKTLNPYYVGSGGSADDAYMFDSDGGGGGGNSAGDWQNQGAFDDDGPFSADGGAAGRAFWAPAERSGGALDPASGNIANIYHAGDGPHSGLSITQLQGLLNGSGNLNLALQTGGVSYSYQTAGAEIQAANGVGGGGGVIYHSGFIGVDQGGDLSELNQQQSFGGGWVDPKSFVFVMKYNAGNRVYQTNVLNVNYSFTAMRNYKPYVNRNFKIPVLGFSLAVQYSVAETELVLANSFDQAAYTVLMAVQNNPSLTNSAAESLFLNTLDGFLNRYFGEHAYAIPVIFTGAPTNNLHFQSYPSN